MSSIILTEEMKKRSLLSTGDDARLCSFFNKLMESFMCKHYFVEE